MGCVVFNPSIHWRNNANVGGNGIMVFVLFLFVFLLGFKFFEAIKSYKAAKQADNVARYDKITLWGYGLGFATVAMMALSMILLTILWHTDGILVMMLEPLGVITAYLGYLIFPIVVYIFLGVVHFSMVKPYRANELTHQEDKVHKTSGIIFYILTVLIIWVIVFLIRVFTGEIHFM